MHAGWMARGGGKACTSQAKLGGESGPPWQLGDTWGNSLMQDAFAFSDGICLQLQRVRPEAIMQACNQADGRGGVNEVDPTGLASWGLAETLAAFVVRRRMLFDGRVVLELGCGRGLCGIVAAHYAAAVTLTDYEPAVLALAGLNAAAAGPALLARGRQRPAIDQLTWSVTAMPLLATMS